MKIDKYSKAFSEVYEIIMNLDEDLKKKIPDKFIKFLTINKDNSKTFHFNDELSINEQKISEEAKMILSAMYEAYIATQEEKKEIIKAWQENIFKKPLEN